VATLIDIANRALVFIGEARVLSLDQSSKAAREANSQVDFTRRVELTRNRWTFAMARTGLAASATSPAFGFAYCYPFPADALAIDTIGDFYSGPSLSDFVMRDEKPFEIEGRNILSDLQPPLNVRYVRDESDASRFNPLFGDVIAWRLANDLCRTLTGSSADFQRLIAGYQLALKDAYRVNAVERPPARSQETSFITARL
jgi:hypothetical protein